MSDLAVPLLVVEDETVIAMMLDEVLSDAGFKPLLVRTGDEALAALDRDAARFRGVVTGVHLGRGPSGWDVARHARALVPTMPVVYLVGGLDDEWRARGVPDSVVVPKPFVEAQIVTALATQLNKAPVLGLSPRS